MKLNSIDNGNEFDWGKTSQDYAKYRDIYPQEFYEKILSLGLCKDRQKALDIGTGTGVIPRNMYKYGAVWTGTDISENQIEQAKILAESDNMDIEFYTCGAEDISYPDNTFDVVTACQCIWYPNHSILAPKLAKILKKGGKFLIMYMAWLPFEDDIAMKSEKIILKYNPDWTGAGEIRKNVWVPDEYSEFFDIKLHDIIDSDVAFTRETWNGRMKACRGVSASMSAEDVVKWEEEHMKMLAENTDESFTIKHFISIAELTVRK